MGSGGRLARWWWMVFALVGCRQACPQVEPVRAEPGQNLLLVILDDVSADQLALYGNERGPMLETPSIDCLADQGLVFDAAWAFPTCSPARAAMTTGQYPRRFGIGKHIDADTETVEVSTDAPSVARVLKQAKGGPYAVAHFGKWHMAGRRGESGLKHPLKLGYDHHAGSFANLALVSDLYEGNGSYDTWEKLVDAVPEKSTAYPTRDVVKDAADWIRQTEEPWFATVSFNAPHMPLHAAPRRFAHERVDEDDDTKHDMYRSMLEAADDQIGWLMGRIDRDVLARTTIVIVGDNGAPSKSRRGPNKQNAKGTVYQGGVQVPMVVVGPSVAAPGRTAALVSFADFLPTFAELADAPVPDGLDGTSFAGVLEDPLGDGSRSFLFSEAFAPNGAASSETKEWTAGVRDLRYELVVHAEHADGTELEEELYDLVKGPLEFRRNDLLAGGEAGLSAEQATALAALRAELARVRETVPLVAE